MRSAKVREPLELLRSLGVNMTHVIDVGVQHSTPPLIDAFPNIHHYLFEPVEEYHQHIRNNYAAISHDLIGAAVSDKDGEVMLRTEKKTRGNEISHSYITDKPTQETRSVRTLRLDTYFEGFSARNEYLLKIDVEGPEVPSAILRGAKGILNRVAVVMIEMTVDKFMDRAIILHESGFDLWDAADLCYYGNCLWQLDTFFVRRDLKQSFPALRPMTSQPFQRELWQSGFS